MPQFGTASLDRLAQADPRIQELFKEVVKYADCTVLCSFRGKQEQDAAFAAGNSKLRFPQSKHNSMPSQAVDVMPWHTDKPHVRWPDLSGFTPKQMAQIYNYASIAHFAGITRGIALERGIPIRWGGDFNRNYLMEDKDSWDLPHYQLDDR
jgi:peptidoglycan L-alanyl-D-glutamate endopeptidase CwlK